MREGKYIVNTIEYEVELPKLMRRRLKQFGAEWIMNGADCGRDFVAVRIEDEVSLELWVKAVCEILSKDIAHFEIARLINFIPISLEEKQLALPVLFGARRDVGHRAFTSGCCWIGRAGSISSACDENDIIHSPQMH